MNTTPLLILILTSISQLAMAQKNNITIYSNNSGAMHPDQLQNPYNIPGFAVIRQQKDMTLTKGTTSLAFDAVSAYTDATTVSVKHASKPQAFEVLDQSLQFDLVNNKKLLQKFINQTITVQHHNGQQSIESQGTLLSAHDGLVLAQESGQILAIKSWQNITFPELPEGLLTKPTLVWQIESEVEGTHPIEVSYQSKGMTWWADYNITLKTDGNACHMDLSAWFTLVNKSGASFDNTQLKLVAGDVNQVNHNQGRIRMTAAITEKQNHVQSDELFEYHIYNLPRQYDLPDQSSKQLPLINNITDINCQKILRFDATQFRGGYHQPNTNAHYYRQTSTKPSAHLTFKNSSNNGLGMPLPAGRMRVNTLNPNDGSLEFIGEDRIDHTPEKETIELLLGHAFDVTGSRVQSDYQQHKQGATETFVITLNNRKKEPISIEVIEALYRWSNWKITESNQSFEKMDSQRIKFNIQIPADSSYQLTYTVQYTWPLMD